MCQTSGDESKKKTLQTRFKIAKCQLLKLLKVNLSKEIILQFELFKETNPMDAMECLEDFFPNLRSDGQIYSINFVVVEPIVMKSNPMEPMGRLKDLFPKLSDEQIFHKIWHEKKK